MVEIYQQTDYQAGYPQGIENNFWNIARNDLICRWLRPHLDKSDLILDVGCGTGITVRALNSNGLFVRGVESGDAPVLSGAEGLVTTCTDVFDLDRSSREAVRAALLLDVIEHMHERKAFMRQLFEALPNCRILLLTVPARMELWSDFDAHWGHHLRYNRPNLAAEIHGSGFVPVRNKYFFHSLYLASGLVKILRLTRSNDFKPIPEKGLKKLAHRIIGSLAGLEARIVPGWVVGTSIACLCLRSDSD